MFVAATLICTVLAIWAVVSAPVGSVAGVSGLYIAAAVYVPLALLHGAVPWLFAGVCDGLGAGGLL